MDTAKPWKNPAAMFDAPMPIISWFGSSSSPRRAANADAVAMVSVSDTSTIPIAASSNGPTSDSCVHGNDGVGTPCGSVPTVAISLDNPAIAETIVAAPTATSTAGMRRLTRGSTRSTTNTPTPIANAAAFVSSRWVKNSWMSSQNVSESVENPKSLGS